MKKKSSKNWTIIEIQHQNLKKYKLKLFQRSNFCIDSKLFESFNKKLEKEIDDTFKNFTS